MHNPVEGWGVSGTWLDHMGYSDGGFDAPTPMNTPIGAPASGRLVYNGWVGSAGRRATLYLDTPVKRSLPAQQKEGAGDMVAVVFQHLSRDAVDAYYAEGTIAVHSGASANGQERGGDVHMHMHGLNASGQRVDFLKFLGAPAPTPGPGPIPTPTKRKRSNMLLSWSTTGTGYLNTDSGSSPIANPAIYNLLYRLINSDQSRTPFVDDVKNMIGTAIPGQPMVYTPAEQRLVDDTLTLHNLAQLTGILINEAKLADAMQAVLGKGYRLSDPVDVAALNTAFDTVIPRITNAILKEQAARLAKV